MPVGNRSAPRYLWLRLLRASLLCGALYDLGFAALMVLAPALPSQLLHLPLPGAAFYLWVIAALLGIAAGCYLLAAWDPRRYAGVVGVAIAGRLLGATAFAVAAWRDPALAGLWPLAAADAGFALWHLLAGWPLRR